MPAFHYDHTLRQLQNTRSGRERNMYQHLRDLFTHVLGHPTANIIIDSPQDGTDHSPDLAIRIDTGLADPTPRNGNIHHDWIIIEAKDERAFADSSRREAIFIEKQKYIRPETEWFLMADPECLIVRPVAVRTRLDAAQDRVYHWTRDLATRRDFHQKLGDLAADRAADSPALAAFRAGDAARIATVRVDARDVDRQTLTPAEQRQLAQAKKDFFNVIRLGTRMLQGACKQALADWAPTIADIAHTSDLIAGQWNYCRVTYDPLAVTTDNGAIKSKEEKEKYTALAETLKSKLRTHPAAAKLALSALPAYHRRRAGKDAKNTDPTDINRHTDSFAIESANLMLARIMLLRFFEDHRFFGEKRYLCNGGVAALQQFMAYFNEGYGRLLRAAYQKGGDIYTDAFNPGDLDWTLESPSRPLSRAIEFTMMLLSRFNFSTISGDLLAGIYDRFLDPQQRKTMGEFYTPPSIARYIIRRLDIGPADSVFDPACGSGTFLLEAFEHLTRGDIRNHRGDYAQATQALTQIGGNDLNPFSAIMTHIQMIWQLLPLKDALQEHGFPAIRATGGINAVTARGELHGTAEQQLYASELDRSTHAAVIGNPPYIRPERSGDADDETQEFYTEIGGARKNYYDLFVYKALTRWCRQPDSAGAPPGRIGFVLPLSFCDSGNSAPLRRLFALGGRFRLIEIVDMEAISARVFDATVNPIVLLADNRPATAADKITLRVAGEESLVDEDEFDLGLAPATEFAYADAFTADGRILSKQRPHGTRHHRIIRQIMQTNTMLSHIARPIWTGMDGSRIAAWRETPPEEAIMTNGDSARSGNQRWVKRFLRGGGASFRQTRPYASDNTGWDCYKGENISACAIEGPPAERHVIPERLSTPSLWCYRDILPPVCYAIQRITRGITAARFNPQQHVMLDTATLLCPNDEWAAFPLDIALTARPYQFYYADQLREGIVNGGYSQIYPRTLARIPLPRALLAHTDRLVTLRAAFLQSCRHLHQRTAALRDQLAQLPTQSLQALCRARHLSLVWSDNLLQGEAVRIHAPTPPAADGDRLSLTAATAAGHLEITHAETRHSLAATLVTRHDCELKREDILKLDIPADPRALAQFLNRIQELQTDAATADLEKIMTELDELVGAAFGLSATDTTFIAKKMKNDPTLSAVTPRLPYLSRPHRGRAAPLTSPTRYRPQE